MNQSVRRLSIPRILAIESRNSKTWKPALICIFKINCQSNDSLEASAIKHFYMLFMELGVNEKVSEGTRVKGQAAAASSFSNLYFSAARPPFFLLHRCSQRHPPPASPPPPTSWCQRAVATATSSIRGLWLAAGQNPCAVVMCENGEDESSAASSCACASPCGPRFQAYFLHHSGTLKCSETISSRRAELALCSFSE